MKLFKIFVALLVILGLKPVYVKAADGDLNYSPHLGFVYSGSVNPQQIYPSTFESLLTQWSTSYTPYLVSRETNGVPLKSLGEENGYYYLPNLTHIGLGEQLINVTSWTKPTWFPVIGKNRLQEYLDKDGTAGYYQIGSEPNVLTFPLFYASKFEQDIYWDSLKYWQWSINGGGNYYLDNTNSTQGDSSLLVEASTPNQNWVKSFKIYQTEAPKQTIKGSQAYRVSIDIKTENVVAGESWQGAGLHIYENGVWPGSAAGGGKTPMLTGANDWQTFTFDFTTQANTTYLEFYLGLGFGGNATGKVWFDNLEIRRLGDDNEPLTYELINCYPGEYFAEIFHYYKETLKQIRPNAKIIGPNFLTFSELPEGESEGAYGPYIPGAVWMDSFNSKYQQLYGEMPAFDVYATHVYDNYRPWNRDNYLNYAKRNIIEFKDYIRSNFGEQSRIWITEFGIQTRNVADSETAWFFEQMHTWLLGQRGIEKWFWAWSFADLSYHPFSGLLFTSNLENAGLTAVGQKFTAAVNEEILSPRLQTIEPLDQVIAPGETITLHTVFTDQEGVNDIAKVYLAMAPEGSGDCCYSVFECNLSQYFAIFLDQNSGESYFYGSIDNEDIFPVCLEVCGTGNCWGTGRTNNQTELINILTETDGNNLIIDWTLRLKTNFPIGEYKLYTMVNDQSGRWQDNERPYWRETGSIQVSKDKYDFNNNGILDKGDLSILLTYYSQLFPDFNLPTDGKSNSLDFGFLKILISED